jgi:hypothetical protein
VSHATRGGGRSLGLPFPVNPPLLVTRFAKRKVEKRSYACAYRNGEITIYGVRTLNVVPGFQDESAAISHYSYGDDMNVGESHAQTLRRGRKKKRKKKWIEQEAEVLLP